MKRVNVILSTGTSPSMQQRDFRNSCLLTVHCSWSESKPEITAAGWARKKVEWPRSWLLRASGAKSPWNPTEPHSLSRQQLQTQLLSCEANTSLKQKIHTAHSPRRSVKETTQKHARSLHRQHKHSSGFATRHNIILKPEPSCLPRSQSRKPGCQSKLKWQVKLHCTVFLLQNFHNLWVVWTDLKQHSRRKPLPWDLQPEWGTPAHGHLTPDSLSVLWA